MAEQSESGLFRRTGAERGEITVLYFFARLNLLLLAAWYIAVPALGYLHGWHNVNYSIAGVPFAFGLGWLASGAFYLYKYRRRRAQTGRPQIVWDEREEAVYYKALAWGFGASWTALVLAVGWFIRRYTALGPEEITMVSLSVILGLCFSVLVLFFSLSVIVQKHVEQGAGDD